MLKALGFGLLLATASITTSGCNLLQSQRELSPGVTQAKADLALAESRYAIAQSAIINLARQGVLKGQTLANVKRVENATHASIVAARASVDAGRSDASTLVAAALAAVLRLVDAYMGVK